MITLDTPLTQIKGVGVKFLEKLEHFNIRNVKDLLWHFPNRYEDFSSIVDVADLKAGEHATIHGEIQSIKIYRTWRKKMLIVEAMVSDDSGSIRAVWFNQKFLMTMLKKGMVVNLAGKVTESDKGLVMSHPVHEVITSSKINDDDLRHTGRVVPIYPETKGFTSKAFRFLIKPLLDNLQVEDPLPSQILKKNNLLDLYQALYWVHFPEEIGNAVEAKKRFAFEDLFFLQLMHLRQKVRLEKEKAFASKIDLDEVKELLEQIPFELTHSQKKALWEILKDLAMSHPMNRLLQGDVGSGKTIVAILAALVVAGQGRSSSKVSSAQDRPDFAEAMTGRQTAFMAPTEVLAWQHYNTFKKLFVDFSKGVAIITSSGSKVFYGNGLESDQKKTDLAKSIISGEIKIVFGTHSLIQKNIKFKNLALVVIDEQHRFGVKQRAELLNKSKGVVPHFLSMSATPIPRTLSLAVFGDLDLSIIDELPKGRKEIITKIVDAKDRNKAYAFIRGQVKKGRQIFVICPRIEVSNNEIGDISTGTNQPIGKLYKLGLWEDVRAVKDEYEKLSKDIFPDLKVGMLHGKLKAKEKNDVMNKFKEREIDILVSTSVIEVGVDVPNATIMMIEGADKFGLAQLYQFRGRVGRGEHQSFCLLLTDSSSKIVKERLNSLIEAKNGFELAEKDLALRGPGEFLGESQTGLPDLAMKAVRNPQLVRDARVAAEAIIKADPQLDKHILLKERLDGFKKEIHLE